MESGFCSGRVDKARGDRWEESDVTVNSGLLFGCKILRWDDYMISGLIVNYMRNQKIVMQQRKNERSVRWELVVGWFKAHQGEREDAFILQMPNLTWPLRLVWK